MKEVDAELTRLASRQEQLEEELSEVGADHEALARIGAQLAAIGDDVRAAEERWLALAEEAEAG
jgi:hypothetical protein